MTQPNEEPVPIHKLFITTLNMSSVFLQSYPETNPWDMDTVGVTDLHPPLAVLQPTICPLDDQVKVLALAQAQRTGVNPFYFMCSSNPFFLDNWDLEKAVLPLKGYQVPRTLPYFGISPGLISDPEELYTGDGRCILRAKLDGEPRVLKLFLEAEEKAGTANDSSSGFRHELDAYTHLVHYGVCESGAVPKCYGWLSLSLDDVQSFAARSGSPLSPVVTFLVDTMQSVAGHCWRGLILEDLSGFAPLSIHNVSGTVASNALKALCKVHSAFVQHGNLARQHIVCSPETERVVWIGFGSASCGEGAVSRQSLFHELAQTWSLLYEKLASLPDAFIGFDDDSAAGAALWKRKMVATPRRFSSGAGSLQRVPQATVEAEIETIISAYPEKNLLDWNPPIHNIIPEPKDDHKYDSAELLSAAQEWQARWTDDNLFFKWHGRCPILLQDHQRFAQSGTTFEDYHAPPPLPQIPMDPEMELLECLRETGPHPLLRVHLRGEERLLKVYSGGWWDPEIAAYEPYVSSLAYRTSQQRFEIEKSAYAHLVHYGVCDAGAVPVCYGWMEMSEAHIAQANTLIATTIKDFSSTGWRYRPPFIDPIFVDGSPAAALVLEYIPDAEVLQARNITYELAASAMRAFTRIHGAYVLHGDVPSESKNILVAKGNPGRVVVVDFDHALDLSLSRERLVRGDFRKELQDIWIMLYSYMLPDQRIECALPHPHDV